MQKQMESSSSNLSERLVQALRSEHQVVCVLNRKGRARLLACTNCGEATRCERCQAAVAQTDDGIVMAIEHEILPNNKDSL